MLSLGIPEVTMIIEFQSKDESSCVCNGRTIVNGAWCYDSLLLVVSGYEVVIRVNMFNVSVVNMLTQSGRYFS